MTTSTILAINPPQTGHLAQVVEDMQQLGAPTIRVYWAGDHYIALEGSHRLAAAKQLGLPVNVIVLGDDDTIDHDCDDVDSKRVGDLIEYITSGGWPMSAVAYSLEINPD